MKFPWDDIISPFTQIDLRGGFGEFETHKLFKFPDESIKFELSNVSFTNSIDVLTTLRSNDDIITLALVKSTLDKAFPKKKVNVIISYLMYQQDDREFSTKESFGLKVISNFINQMNFNEISIFHPHSDKVEFIDNVKIIDNHNLLLAVFKTKEFHKMRWIIPDSGAFKTQFKMTEGFGHTNPITCLKSRNHNTLKIETVVNCEDLQGQGCFIVDDICLGGATFIQIAEKLKENNCGKLYLIVSHGVFNKGVDHILEHFEEIYTTDSICKIDHEKVNIIKL